MLSYRHAFHAGNHADVLKHYVLHLVLEYFNQKDKPYWVIDTHAGAGMYQLNGEFASKNAEYQNGIARLCQTSSLPASVQPYVNTVRSFNNQSNLTFYPGSPKIIQSLLRASDKLRLFELHPSDYQILSENFRGRGRQAHIEMQDGFNGLKACLPPPTKRAIVLIDPPYEVKDDYQRVVHSLQDAIKRFNTGTYMVWYPLLQRPEPQQLLQGLQSLAINDWLNVSLTVQHLSAEGFGMHGSGMFIINPPWTLPATLEASMPALTTLLAIDDGACFEINSHIS